MIAKERNPQEHRDTDACSRAGAEAEKTMAYYLRRGFADATDVAVFNDLRIVDDAGVAAQFDHLILHRHGFVVVESKSVTSAVRVNEAGEWMRERNGRWEGMKSPVLQAKLQMELLKKVLSAHREELRGKLLFGKLQKGFNATPFDVLVAISDKGRIDRDKNTPPEVYKAEAVVEAIRAILARHKKGARGLALNFKDGTEDYPEQEFAAICNFLVKRHTPRLAPTASPPRTSRIPATASAGQATAARESAGPYSARAACAPAAQPQPAAVASPQEHPKPAAVQQTCPKCNASDLIVLHSRYGYYWKCKSCGSTRNTDHACPKCGEKTKTHKKGLLFFRECTKCKTSEHFHTNAQEE